MAVRIAADLMPGRSGNNYTAEFTGRHNAQALERATEITVYGGVAANVIEVSDTDDGTVWRASGAVIAASGLTHISSPPVCRAIRVAAEVAAAQPPVKIIVRHGL